MVTKNSPAGPATYSYVETQIKYDLKFDCIIPESICTTMPMNTFLTIEGIDKRPVWVWTKRFNTVTSYRKILKGVKIPFIVHIILCVQTVHFKTSVIIWIILSQSQNYLKLTSQFTCDSHINRSMLALSTHISQQPAPERGNHSYCHIKLCRGTRLQHFSFVFWDLFLFPRIGTQ